MKKSYIVQLKFQGIRSYHSEFLQELNFHEPFTIILGENGSGKTSIIETIKYALTGTFPSMSDGGKYQAMNPDYENKTVINARIELHYKSKQGNSYNVSRVLQLSKASSKLSLKSKKATCWQQENAQRKNIDNGCTELNYFVPNNLGFKTAILEHVIFCHQEDSLWPVNADARLLKEKLDEIFDTERINKIISKLDDEKRIKKNELELLAKDITLTNHNLKAAEQAYQDNENKIKSLNQLKLKRDKEIAQLDGTKANVKKIEANVLNLSIFSNQLKMNKEKENQIIKNQVDKIHTLLKINVEDLKIYILDNSNDWSLKIKDVEFKLSNINDEQKVAINHIKELRENNKKYDKEINEINKVIGALSNFNSEDMKKELRNTFELLKTELDLDIDDQLSESNYPKFKNINDENQNYQISRKSKIDQEINMKNNEIVIIKDQLMNLKLEIMTQNEKSRTVKNDIKTSIDEIIEYIKCYDINTIKSSQFLDIINFPNDNIENIEINMLNDLNYNMEKFGLDIDIMKNNQTNELNIVNETKINISSKIFELKSSNLAFETFRNLIEEYLSINSSINDILSNLKLKYPQLKLDNFNKFKKQANNEDIELRSQQKEFQEESKETLNSFLTMKTKLEMIVRDIDLQTNKIDDLQSKLSNNKKFQELKRIITQDIEVQKVMAKHFPEIEVHNINDMDTVKDIQQKLNSKSQKQKEDIHQLEISQQIRLQLQEGSKSDGVCLLCKNDNIDFTDLQNTYKNDNLSYDKLIKKQKEKGIEIDKAINTISTVYVSLDSENINKIITDHKERLDKNIKEKVNLQVVYEEYKSKNDQMSEKITKHSNQVEEHFKVIESFKKLDAFIKSRQDKHANILKFNKQNFQVDPDRPQVETNLLDQKIENELNDYNFQLDHLNQKLNSLNESQNQFMKYNNKYQMSKDKFIRLLRNYKDYFENKDYLISKQDNYNIIEKEIEKFNILIEDMYKESEECKLQIDNTKNNQNLIIKQYEQFQKYQDFLNTSNNVKLGMNETKLNELIISKEKNDRIITNQNQTIDDYNSNKYIKLQELQGQQIELRELYLKDEEHRIQLENNTQFREVQENMLKEMEQSKSSINFLDGKIQIQEDGVKQQEYQNIELCECRKKLTSVLAKKVVLEHSVEDLNRFQHYCREKVTAFHKVKLETINSHIHSLWGLIQSKREVEKLMLTCEQQQGNRSKQNQRVVKVDAEDRETEFRGRSSAGEKMLASIVIRMALAAAFSSSGMLLALDEPTTNLDRESISNLAEALAKIQDKHKDRMQVIIITHDKTFVDKLNDYEVAMDCVKVQKLNGFSKIIQNKCN